MIRLAISTTLFVAFWATPLPTGAQDLDQRIPVEPGGLLQIDLDLGPETRSERVLLEIRSHEADEVYAVADLEGLGASTVRFRVDRDERGVRLYGRSGGILSWLFGGPGLTVRVWIPREFDVDARNESGPIRIEDLSGNIRARSDAAAVEIRSVVGNVRVHSETGRVEISEVEGEVRVRVTSAPIELAWITGRARVQSGGGDISARHLEGELELRTDRGEVGLRDVRGRAHVKTERGSVYASFAAAPEGRLETQRGSVEVVFPGHTGADLDARSGEGTVQVLDGLVVATESPSDRYVGAVNGGGRPLEIYTARGNVRVGRR